MWNLIHFFRVKKLPEFVQIPLEQPEMPLVEMGKGDRNYRAAFFHLLYEPQIIGILLPQELSTFEALKDITTLRLLKKNGSALASLDGQFEKAIRPGKATLGLFRVEKATLHIGFTQKILARRMYLRALKRKKYVLEYFDAGVFDKILSFFYYPKPVFLVSTAAALPNSFPVDTCRETDGYYIFGVRKSNKAMQGVKPGDTVSVGVSDFTKKDQIYQLGKFSAEKKNISYLAHPQYGISVPDIVSGYKWVEITEILEYKAQNIYIGKIVSGAVILNQSPQMAHINKLWLMDPARGRDFNLF